MQLIGTRRCALTRKAERFFRERGVAFHFVDLSRRPLSRGELEALRAGAKGEALVDEDSPEAKKRGLTYLDYDEIKLLSEHPSLMKTPVVREGGTIIIGDNPPGWAEVAKKAR